jgi:hypothetical protein
LQILIQPTDEAVKILANEVDLIVTSRSRAAQIRRLNLSIPLIELSFHISRESANRVVDALYNATNADQIPSQEVAIGRRTPAQAV